jgi:hypothetical protein
MRWVINQDIPMSVLKEDATKKWRKNIGIGFTVFDLMAFFSDIFTLFVMTES